MSQPKKLGTLKFIEAQTGEVLEERRNAMTLLPPRPDVCQECAVDHAHDQPHDQQSVYYQMHFHSIHGRWPTWSDAMAHCTEQTRTLWRATLIESMKKRGLAIPADLKSPKTGREAKR